MDDPWSRWRTMGMPGAQPSASAAGFAQAAERFAGAAQRYLAETAAAANDRAATDTAARRFGDFLREQAAPLFRPPWSADLSFGAAADRTPKTPALGATREHQQRLERTAEAARLMGEALGRLQSLWSDTLCAAAAAFAARVATAGSAAPGTAESGTAEAGDAEAVAESLRRLYGIWIDCAEAAYADTAHSDAYCRALADFVNAGSQWRAELAVAAEHASKWLDLPTRSEVESLTRRLACLERELRSRTEQPRAAKRPHTPHPPPRRSGTRRAKRVPKS